MSGGIESARLKVVRAMNIRGAAAEAIKSYVASQPYEVMTDTEGRETVRITKPPPSENRRRGPVSDALRPRPRVLRSCRSRDQDVTLMLQLAPGGIPRIHTPDRGRSPLRSGPPKTASPWR